MFNQIKPLIWKQASENFSCISAISVSYLAFCSVLWLWPLQHANPLWHMGFSLPSNSSHGAWLWGTSHVLPLVIHLSGLFPLGVIAAVVFVLICLLVVMVRYMYRHKGTYHTNEAKGTEFAESADAALKNDPALQEAVDESKKEYFIWEARISMETSPRESIRNMTSTEVLRDGWYEDTGEHPNWKVSLYFFWPLGCFFSSNSEELNARYLPVDFISNTAGHSQNQYHIRRNKISVWVIHQNQIKIANVKPWHLVKIADAKWKHPLRVNDASYSDMMKNYLKLNFKW